MQSIAINVRLLKIINVKMLLFLNKNFVLEMKHIV
jgi:hypothetical protein